MTSREASAAIVTAQDACAICHAPRDPSAETARVRCNVRAFRGESFVVWRCTACRSIHAQDAVDLAHYYAGYPVFAATLDWKLRVVYGNMLRRLQRAGLQPGHRILDYGCGSGLLVQYLRERGYEAAGFDRFAPGFDDPRVLEQSYDCIVSQDVIEHVESPHALLEELFGLVQPGGLVSIGTPDAAALDLRDPEDFVHALHLPFHRHILSMAALEKAGAQHGFAVVHRYDTMYNNTLVPTMNPRFALHYVRSHDDMFDLVVEPVRASLKLVLSPLTPLLLFFGYFFDRHTDIQVVFVKPKVPEAT